MALTPEQLAEIQRLKALMQQPATDAQRKAQAVWNAEQMTNKKAKGGSAKSKFVLDESDRPLRVYHGTNQNIQSFSNERLGANSKTRSALAHFFTEDPREAGEYAAMSGRHQFAEAPEFEKKSVKLQKDIERAEARGQWDLAEKLYAQLEQLEATHSEGGENIMPIHLLASKVKTHDMKHTADLDLMAKLIKQAKAEKMHALKLENVYDPVQERPEAFSTNQWVMFDPKRIKSAIGNRGTYDPNDPDITKAQGGTVNAFDYENPEHVSSVAGHAAKHKDFSKIPDASKHLGEVIGTGNYKHIEDPRILGAIRKAGFGGYHTLEKTGKKLTPFAVKKAMGGTVEQMRQELQAAGKPTNDISQIGANEAPNMPVKSFVVPNNGATGPLPMGGVDMSPMQPGQQMLPANAMQPNPLAPQQPQPPAGPAPADGSNILQMTPQGQAMAAMQPQAPVQKAVGGTVGNLPVQNRPFMSAGDRPLPFMAKDGGSDNAPMNNNYSDNGATDFSIDNIQQMAKGGEAKKPLHYEPSPSLKKADIEAMARQMAGQDNPNQKTLQQLAREQNLPIGIKSSKKMDVPVINYEDLKGSYSVGVPGDTSRGGVKPTKSGSMGAPKAGEYLHSIGGEKLDQPVGLFGGKDYGAFGHPAGWASDFGASAGMFNVVKKLAEENPERDVYGHYHKMSPEALNHAVHMLDAVLSHHKPHASPAERIAMLNDLMRNQKTTTSKHDVPYPEFPGFENPADIMLQGQMNSGMRKKIIGLLGKEKYFPGGKQKLDDIIYAISHPELRNIETGAGGSAIIKFDPTRNLKESMSPHPTYGHDIPSKLAGRTRYITPAELLAPRSMHNAKKEIAAMGKKVVPFNQAKMNIIREPIDEQYINQMGEYEMAMKKRLGYKKGGSAKTPKVADNLDTMRLALTRNKKAK